MPKIKKTRIAAGIFLLRFETQYALASTFLRIQEHYESTRFRNRVFTLEEFMDWYAGEHDGEFTYFTDWAGFNVPSTAFEPFLQGSFDPLLQKEQRLLRLFKRERVPFYVIGIYSDGDLKHEVAHALFFTRPSYRKAVLAALARYDTSRLRKYLGSIGYHRAVLTDEVHAYLISPSDRATSPTKKLLPLQRELRKLFKQHSAGIPLQSK